MAVQRVAWSLVVPVKRLSVAKTRLAVPAGDRADLALAMALDTVRAAVRCPAVVAVVAVSDDERAVPLLRAEGARVVPDEPDAGLNPALRHGATAAAARHPGSAVAAISSDLPALRPTDLARLLDRAAKETTACVADVAGTGTTVYAAARLEDFFPRFGPGSRAAHVWAGATDLTGTAGVSLRRDVDTLADLADAARLGCGQATAALLASHRALWSS